MSGEEKVSSAVSRGPKILPAISAKPGVNSWRRDAPREVTMSLTGRQARRNIDPAAGGTQPGATKGTRQAKIPPARTWLWFLAILLANYHF
jgi:hypothetical protein